MLGRYGGEAMAELAGVHGVSVGCVYASYGDATIGWRISADMVRRGHEHASYRYTLALVSVIKKTCVYSIYR